MNEMNEKIDAIKALKKDPSSVATTAYNEAIDKVLEILTGEKVLYPDTRCIDCDNSVIYNDQSYYCDARDDLGGEDGEIEIDMITEEYICASFLEKRVLDRNKIGKGTCPKCGKEGVFYLFSDPYRGLVEKRSSVCPSCKYLIFEPEKKITFVM